MVTDSGKQGYITAMSPYDILAEAFEDVFPCPSEAVEYVKRFAPDGNGRVLDLGCATGELDRILCDHGFHVDAVDDSASMISHALSKRRCGVDNPRFHHSDMMKINNLFMPSCFGQILCLGNTLPHLADRHHVRCLLSKCRKLLTGSGSMTIQILDYDSAPGKPGWVFPVVETETIRFRRSYTFENDRLVFDISVEDMSTGKGASTSLTILPITWEALKEDARRTGFTYFERYGGFDGTPYFGDGVAYVARLI